MIIDSSASEIKKKELEPIPNALVQFYAILAILLVLIPEWLAEGFLIINSSRSEEILPEQDIVWSTQPELQLTGMNIYELRHLAMSLHLHGYASESRNALSRRLLRKINSKARKKTKRKVNIFNSL